jgi:catechol-2,3-dioxygenase
MLSDYPIDVVLLASDVEASKAFYANKVGLKIINAAADRVRFQCGGDSHLVISGSTVGTNDGQTQAVFRVKDLRGEVAELRRRGVKIEEYDIPGVKTVDGIADMGFATAAWFIDPGKNCVGMIQIKQP